MSDVYPDEKEKLARVWIDLNNRFEFTSCTEADRKIFDMAVANEFGKIGFKARVHWSEICEADGTPTGVLEPTMEVYGRTRGESETDHDRIRYGVVHGLDDGVAGYVRGDGSLREDPKSKNIF